MRGRAFVGEDAAFQARERFREVASEVDLPDLAGLETASARPSRGLREVLREVGGQHDCDLSDLAGGSLGAPAREVAKGPCPKCYSNSVEERERIAVVGFAAANNRERRSGLLGWMVLEVDGLLRLDGVALRLTRSGRLSLGFPCRRDGRGDRHPVVRPLGTREREEIERAVFAALGGQEALR